MRPEHLETFRPRCPFCTAAGRDSRVGLAESFKTHEGHVVEGVLRCGDAACAGEFPIIDGVPVLRADVREVLAAEGDAVHQRRDFSPGLESILHDAIEPGTRRDLDRYYASVYGWDGYGEGFDREVGGPWKPGSSLAVLRSLLDKLDGDPAGPCLDLGCAVGRTTFELAERTGSPTLGVDSNLSLLRIASSALIHGRVTIPVRREGVRYDRCSAEVSLPGRELVDFWCCDAMALPFDDGTVGLASALCLIDCVASPVRLITELERVLARAGTALLASPYDWTVGATPIEAWLGGHSPRSDTGGRSDEMLRLLLTPGAHPQSAAGLSIVGEVDDLVWRTRLHDRAALEYRVHGLVVRRSGAAG